MYASNQFMSLKMIGGPPVKSPWWVSVIGPPIVIGMLVGMIVWFSFNNRHQVTK